MKTSQDQHYLKEELRSLIQSDAGILAFLDGAVLDGIWIHDLEHPENEWMSPHFWDALGYDPADMPHSPKSWHDIVDPADLEIERTNFEPHCNDASHPYDQTLRFRHKDGSTVIMRRRGIAMRDADGRAVRMLGAHINLTDDLKTGQGTALTDLSHDLRTPLNSLLAMAEALDSTTLDSEQRATLIDMRRAGEQMTDLLSDRLKRLDLELPESDTGGDAVMMVDPDAGAGAQPLRGLKILVAEDVLLNRRSLKQLLAGSGAELTFALDGDEALRLLKTIVFDVALIDLRMPRKNGIDVLKEYRAFESLQSRQKLYAILCSAYVTPEDWPEYEKAGFQDVLEKPFTRTDLTDVVMRVVEGR